MRQLFTIKTIILSAFVVALGLMAIVIWARLEHQNHSLSPYAGQQSREIKSLSRQDIEELRAGRGWGLALPAELNGLPGPAHILELQEELALDSAQIENITQIYEEMQSMARQVGEEFIASEATLNEAFASGGLDKDELKQLLAESERTRAELRFIHLSAHLSTPQILTSAQINDYQVLRGYTGNPCKEIPEGHDSALWRLHNGCS